MNNKVIGYQFEPTKPRNKDCAASDSSWTTYDSSDEDEEVLNNIQLVARNTADPKSWCSCSQCATMETDKGSKKLVFLFTMCDNGNR